MKKYIVTIIIFLCCFNISAQEKVKHTRKRDKIQKTWENTIKDTSIMIKLTADKYAYLMENKVDIGVIASQLLENYSIKNKDGDPVLRKKNSEIRPDIGPDTIVAKPFLKGERKVVNARIKEDGGLELKFLDGNIVLFSNSSKVPILGQEGSHLNTIQDFVPPKSPTESDFQKYLFFVDMKLLNVLDNLLKEDPSSLKNFKNAGINKDLYVRIYSSIHYINSIIYYTITNPK